MPAPDYDARLLTEVQRTCYRCGKPEGEQCPLRLLPGSTHIVVCPACYAVLWVGKCRRVSDEVVAGAGGRLALNLRRQREGA